MRLKVLGIDMSRLPRMEGTSYSPADSALERLEGIQEG